LVEEVKPENIPQTLPQLIKPHIPIVLTKTTVLSFNRKNDKMKAKHNE
jgi:hypothetical protein